MYATSKDSSMIQGKLGDRWQKGVSKKKGFPCPWWWPEVLEALEIPTTTVVDFPSPVNPCCREQLVLPEGPTK